MGIFGIVIMRKRKHLSIFALSYVSRKCQFGTSNGTGTENGYGSRRTYFTKIIIFVEEKKVNVK